MEHWLEQEIAEWVYQERSIQWPIAPLYHRAIYLTQSLKVILQGVYFSPKQIHLGVNIMITDLIYTLQNGWTACKKTCIRKKREKKKEVNGWITKTASHCPTVRIINCLLVELTPISFLNSSLMKDSTEEEKNNFHRVTIKRVKYLQQEEEEDRGGGGGGGGGVIKQSLTRSKWINVLLLLCLVCITRCWQLNMGVLLVYQEGRKKGRMVFYLTTHLTHFIYGYMALDIL